MTGARTIIEAGHGPRPVYKVVDRIRERRSVHRMNLARQGVELADAPRRPLPAYLVGGGAGSDGRKGRVGKSHCAQITHAAPHVRPSLTFAAHPLADGVEQCGVSASSPRRAGTEFSTTTDRGHP